MLVYEKTNSSGERHLYGNYSGTCPTASDQPLNYKDSTGAAITNLTFTETYLDDKEGGILRKTGSQAVNVYIGDHLIIGKVTTTENNTPTETVTGISVKLIDGKTSFDSNETIETQYFKVFPIYGDGSIGVVAYDIDTYTVSPNSFETTGNHYVTITHTATGYTKKILVEIV